MQMLEVIRHIPILTTVLAVIFGTAVFRRYWARRSSPYLFWWAIGIYIYGVGTLTEGLTTLFGWDEVVFRAWYISGALLGGAPLATGSAYFHLSRRTANVLTALVVSYIVVASCFVILTPIDMSLVEEHHLSGKVMEWSWVRLFSPIVNLYAVTFLIGGAAMSAWRARRDATGHGRAWGNALIAFGALLPGIGGTFTRLGYTEVLYVMEIIGLTLIWRGYLLCIRPVRPAVPEAVPVGAQIGALTPER